MTASESTFFSPIAFMRAGEQGELLIAWQDTVEGWKHLTEASNLPRSALSLMATVSGLGEMAPGVVVVEFATQTLPEAVPVNALIAVHPDLMSPEVPTWDGPTSREEELAQAQGGVE